MSELAAEAKDEELGDKAEFAVSQLVDALAPTNFLLGNPTALKRAFETGGRSVVRGFTHFVDDVVTNGGWPRQVDSGALELGPPGITVNALGIGATVNERNLRDDPDYAARWAAVVPAGRVGRPEDVAAALAYLVSPEAAMVTGHTLVVDGGWTVVGDTPD